MKKTIDTSLIVSTFICLAPIFLSLAIYDTLPEQIAIHWNAAGSPDHFVPKAIAAFGLPILLAAINMIVSIALNRGPKTANASSALKAIGKWCAPAISVVLQPIILFIAMGASIPIHIIVPALTGVLVAICGNYLPKCKQNFSVGIKLPWTMSSEQNWNRTHRISGYTWILGGFMIIENAFFNSMLSSVIIICLLVLIPILYSYILYKNGV